MIQLLYFNENGRCAYNSVMWGATDVTGLRGHKSDFSWQWIIILLLFYR
jgi:hypothetical protein